MKKLILSMVLFVAIINPIACMANEFFVTSKFNTQKILNEMKERKWNIIDVVPLDNDKDGYVKIIYWK